MNSTQEEEEVDSLLAFYQLYNGRCVFRVLNFSYYPETFEAMANLYAITDQIYGNAILVLGPLSIFVNVFTAFVLSRKVMRNSYNLILLLMLLDQTLYILIKVSLNIHTILLGTDCRAERFTFGIAIHNVIEQHTNNILRAHVVWLAASLTAFRLRTLRSEGRWEASYRLVMGSSVVLLLAICVARFPVFKILIVGYAPLNGLCGEFDVDGPQVPYNTWSMEMFDNDCLLNRLTYWVTGTFNNMLSSILLLASSILLTTKMIEMHRKHVKLASQNNTSARKTSDAVRTTRMLLGIAFLTLISELPQGLLNIANSLLPITFRYFISENLDAIWEFIQVIATTFDVLVYLVMSSKFREIALRSMCFWQKSSVQAISSTSGSRSVTRLNPGR